MTAESREDLLIFIEEEAERLSRFVGNLLDITRIESGTLEPKSGWIELKEVIPWAVGRTQKLFPDARIDTSLASDLSVTPKEYDLLAGLARSAGKVLSPTGPFLPPSGDLLAPGTLNNLRIFIGNYGARSRKTATGPLTFEPNRVSAIVSTILEYRCCTKG